MHNAALDFTSLSNEELAEQFAELSLNEFDAELGSENKRMNRLARATIAITRVLRSRGPEALRLLLPLLDHQNAQVRLNGARAVMSVERERAIATLQDLHRRGPGAQRGASGMSLYHLESGIWKP